ncbi:MAG: hypothetical protein ACJ763_05435 [Bdellovibrionia bacterium]
MIRSSSIYVFVSVFAVSLALEKSSRAAETTVLAPIVVEGSTADVLLYDPIVFTRVAPVAPTSSNGSVVRKFEEELPVPVTDFGTPGTTTQLRGLGRTVEDTNVQTLGVPLNPVIGGGFDFSSFPEFFWSNYSFHLGPSTGGFDPRAASGTLSLMPWTSAALRGNGGKANALARVTELVSKGLNQASVAGAYGNAAALVGLSSYNAQGPTGSLSARLAQDDRFDLRAHLLATSIDRTSPGPNTDPTPNARLKTTRWIPILEANVSPTHELLIKESAFYDRNAVRFVNPDSSALDSYDRSSQIGSETVALWKDWTFGLSLRRTEFTQIGGEAPQEWIGHLQAERIFRAGSWTTQASAQADWMNLYGARPGASLGERYDITSDWGVFAKTNFTYRYPSLQDRYYQGASFVANPNLSLERALSFNIGNQWKHGQFEATEQFYFQFRSNAQLLQFNSNTGLLSVMNGGEVRQLSYWDDLTWHALPYLDLGNALRLSSSRVDLSASRIPYDPLLTEIVNLRFHQASDQPFWNVGGALRVVTSSPDGLGGTNGGYSLFDLNAGLRYQNLGLQGRIDNVLDRRIQVYQGYPWPGRLFSLSLIAAL